MAVVIQNNLITSSALLQEVVPKQQQQLSADEDLLLCSTFTEVLSLNNTIPSSAVSDSEVRHRPKAVAVRRLREKSKHKVVAWLNSDCEKNKNDKKPAIPVFTCGCWPSATEPWCRTACPLQTASLYYSLCRCYHNKGLQVNAIECYWCCDDFYCKTLVLLAAKLPCRCANSEKYARDCPECVSEVELILSERFPACACKDSNSSNLYACRPYCEYRLNDIYKKWFKSGNIPPLIVWQNSNLKPVLPVCICWENSGQPLKCVPECSLQISEKFKSLYSESCPCNSKANYKIDDKYVWLFRCHRCKVKVSNG
jgi:hypothetical protein